MKAFYEILNGARITIILLAVVSAVVVPWGFPPVSSISIQLASIAVIAALKS